MAADRRGHYAPIVGAASALVWASLTTSSWAQVGAFGGITGPSLTPPPVVVDRGDPFVKTTNNYGGLPVGLWILYPTVFAGAAFDSNTRQSATDKPASVGARLVPSLLAEATDGIHKSTVYGMVDARAYGDRDAGNNDAVAARTGFIQRYQPAADLVVTAQGDYTRQKDLFSTFGIDHSVTTLNPTSIGLAPVTNPLAYNQFAAMASVQKTFDRAFVSFSGSVVDVLYDHHATSVAASPDGAAFTGTGRGGFWFTPFLYAYVEGSADQRRYSTSEFNSSGYRAVGGIGSDQIGLFRGEVYGGYQAERFDFHPLDTATSAVFGGRVYYYPLRELTIAASLDESLGVSLLQAAPGSPGSATRVTTSLLQATYALAREWAASARFGYIHTDFIDTGRRDDAWTAGSTLTYSVWQNFGLTLDYQYVQIDSNVPLQSTTRSVVTVGALYKY